MAETLKRLAQRAHSVPARVGAWSRSRRARSQATGARASDRIYSLYFRAEQAPDPGNRVVLSDRFDIAGSSVFATGGYTNPTFTLVTLALRLADTLRKRLQAT